METQNVSPGAFVGCADGLIVGENDGELVGSKGLVVGFGSEVDGVELGLCSSAW